MKKSFIYSRDLGEIMEAIAEEALKHSDKVSTSIYIRRGSIEVSVNLNTSPYTVLSTKDYDIISEVEDSTDALDHIFGDAIVALEDLSVIKTDNESNN